MYCKNYGNELRDGDKFCSKCGCKISRDVQDNSTLSTTTDTKLHTIKKFFTYLIIFSTFILLVYGIFTPPNFSIIDFIEDPSGFTSVIAEAFGSGLAMLIFILPLLYGIIFEFKFDRQI